MLVALAPPAEMEPAKPAPTPVLLSATRRVTKTACICSPPAVEQGPILSLERCQLPQEVGPQHVVEVDILTEGQEYVCRGGQRACSIGWGLATLSATRIFR